MAPHKFRIGRLLEIVVPASRATALMTTLLVLGLAAFAVRNGDSLGDLYLKYFPPFRGASGSSQLPAIAYVGFVAYVVSAAEVALFFRRSRATPPVRQRRRPRPFGLAAGTFVVPDDFDDPLPEDVLRDFEQ